mmetsp:Transcript_39939/g.105530  ORF Transcript_39939/g.105530 Transcript_39939/m.105530 type:complete len:90 (+) Transcript_39939:1179-1448(+)
MVCERTPSSAGWSPGAQTLGGLLAEAACLADVRVKASTTFKSRDKTTVDIFTTVDRFDHCVSNGIDRSFAAAPSKWIHSNSAYQQHRHR